VKYINHNAYDIVVFEFFQGYNHVSQTVYYEEFRQNCQMIRQYISSTDIPIDFVPNAYGYLLHVCSILVFCLLKHFNY
jgi:hypothetical protein